MERKTIIRKPAYVSCLTKQAAEKRVNSQVASQYVHDGDIIVLDVSTTTLELTKALSRHRNLIVFTASLPIALTLADSDASNVLVGGALRKRELSISGYIAAQTTSQYHFDKFFLGTTGISVT